MTSYLTYCKASGMTKDTVDNHKRALSKFFEYFAKEKIITPMHITEYKSMLYDKGLKQSTIRCYLESISLYFTWASETGIVDMNPCKKNIIKTKIMPSAPYEHLLEKEEVVALLDPVCPKGATRKTWERTYAIICVLLTSGIRNTELRELRIEDLDPINNRLIVRFGKGGKTRYAPYPKIAQQAVETYLDLFVEPFQIGSDKTLFGKGQSNSRWKSFGRTELSTLVERYVKCVTGKENIRTHALRHSAASVLWDSGLAVDDIQELLGHSSVATTKIYLERLRPEVPTKQANNIFDNLCIAN